MLKTTSPLLSLPLVMFKGVPDAAFSEMFRRSLRCTVDIAAEKHPVADPRERARPFTFIGITELRQHQGPLGVSAEIEMEITGSY